MRAVFVEVPEWLLEQRRDIGIDHRDEIWDGVLHLVALPLPENDALTTELACALNPIVESRGLRLRTHEHVGSDDDNYRVPDIAIVRDAHVGEAALAGAALVIEMLGPSEEAHEKLPFYSQ